MPIETLTRLTRTPTTKRTARPVETNYLLDLTRRFGGAAASGLSLIAARMDLIGSSNQPRCDYMVVNRIAVIDVCGVLCNDPCWWDETGYDELQTEFRGAAADPNVDGILMLVNSPGGETDNAFETATVIAGVGKVKPIYSVASPIAYSAAYLFACQAERIYTPAITGGVGSVGVYALHLDYSGALEKAGIKPTLVSAGTGKTDGNPYEPLSPEAKAKIVEEIQRLYGEFVAQVAVGRKMGESAIIKLGAAVFEGSKAAIGAGLADQAGSPEQALVDLTTRVAQPKQIGSSATAGAQNKGEQTMDKLNPAAAATPAPGVLDAGIDVTKVKADAHEAGFAQAHEIVELCALAGYPAEASGFINARKSVADVRTALLEKKAAANGKPGETRGAVLPEHGAGATKAPKRLAEFVKERAAQEGRL